MDIQSDKSMFSARQHISNEKGVAYFVPDDYKKKNFEGLEGPEGQRIQTIINH